MIGMADGNAQVILIAPGVYGQKVPGGYPGDWFNRVRCAGRFRAR